MQIKFTAPDADALRKFLIDEKGFADNRVEAGIKRLEVRDDLNTNAETSQWAAAATLV